MTRLLLALLLAVQAVATNVTGTWAGTITPTDQPDNPQPVHLVLKQEGEQLTGTGGPNAERQMPIQNGVVKGDRVSLEVVAGTGLFRFTLQIKSNDLTGRVEFVGGDVTREGSVALRREP
jgi:hypothetical protein